MHANRMPQNEYRYAYRQVDPLREARGIVHGLLLAAPFWAVVGVVVWSL